MLFGPFIRRAARSGRRAALCMTTAAVADHFYRRDRIWLDSDQSTGRNESPRPSGTQSFSRPLSRLQEKKPVTIFSNNPSSVDKHLQAHEESYTPGIGGISRIDVVQFACATPTEDDFSTMIVPVPSGHWSFFALFDGHVGWKTSAWLRENLIPALIGSLSDLYTELSPSSDSIASTIKSTFLALDDDICNLPLERVFSSPVNRTLANTFLAQAYAGSCALLAFYDSSSHHLHTALTGDLRAVLGRRSSNDPTTYKALPLTRDQNAHNPSELSRLNAAHSGETVVQDGRILGWGISRAFGDALMKWPVETARKLYKEGWMGRRPYGNVKTPPYFTAEPEVGGVEIREGNGDFLVLATDRFWECLTNEEAVGLVGMWSDGRRNRGSEEWRKEGGADVDRGGVSKDDLPVDWSDGQEKEKDETVRWRQWGLEKKTFVLWDRENVATHLLRNALGGAENDVTSALLSMRQPRKRSYVDDITIMVVFFD